MKTVEQLIKEKNVLQKNIENEIESFMLINPNVNLSIEFFFDTIDLSLKEHLNSFDVKVDVIV